jgi:hypothetical protein
VSYTENQTFGQVVDPANLFGINVFQLPSIITPANNKKDQNKHYLPMISHQSFLFLFILA